MRHDPVIGAGDVRVSNGDWYDGPDIILKHARLEELGAFDIGEMSPNSHWINVFPDSNKVTNEPILTLDQAFDILCAAPRSSKILLDIKTDPFDRGRAASPEEIIPPVLEVIGRRKLEDQVCLIALEWASLSFARERHPKIRTAPVTWPGSEPANAGPSPWNGLPKGFDDERLFAAMKHLGADIWDAYADELSANRVARAHAQGLKVGAWGLIDCKKSVELADIGVDMITSPWPDQALDSRRSVAGFDHATT